ncbi:MAG TPA: sensor histidine kinase KdpD [Gaiellaceae bacterium]
MRGHYRILLGAAAGVGKTYRMLQEGQQAKAAGRDIVIGYLEPHNRPETAALAEGMEVVPPLEVPLGDLTLKEMDLGAVLERRPRLALVDELAHTNAPGMTHEKRWQDIDDILDAGIDVISTVNIQHLESLNDTVAEMTGVRVRETFPDNVLERADEVVLVDLSPEALLERLETGKIYPKEHVKVALRNFFRLENLAALREISLSALAADVGLRRQTEVLDPLSQQAVAERLLVLVTPEPRSQRVLRRAWRSGQQYRAEVDALWVRNPRRELSDEETMALAAMRRLASILGVHFYEEEGEDFVEVVRRVTHERGATYVFVGTPTDSRLRELMHGSILSRLVRGLPGIDVRIVADRALREE